jgi:PHD/YefM family antitoxin component YafN of YafNO toxin-antitoxin module
LRNSTETGIVVTVKVLNPESAMTNTVTVAEIKRRGMAAIEDGLRRGPVHIVKRNQLAAVVLSEDEYQRLAHGKMPTPGAMTAVQWLLAQPAGGKRSKAQIDAALKIERTW